MADNFNLRTFLSENRLTKNAKLLKEEQEEQGLSYPYGEFGQAVKDIFEYNGPEEIQQGPDVIYEQIDELIQEFDLDPMDGEINVDAMEAKLLQLYNEAQTMSTEEFGEHAYNELSDASLFMGGEGDSFEDDLDEADFSSVNESLSGLKQKYRGDIMDNKIGQKSLNAALEKDAEYNKLEPSEQRKLKTYLQGVLNAEYNESKKPTMEESKLTAKERRLVEMVQDALGLAPQVAEDEMVKETPIPRYESVEDLMKEIEEGTNRVAEEHKIAEMKRIAEALRTEAKKMEESEHAQHIDPKVLKKYVTDAAKIEKAAEKLKAALEKASAGKEKKEASKEEEK